MSQYPKVIHLFVDFTFIDPVRKFLETDHEDEFHDLTASFAAQYYIHWNSQLINGRRTHTITLNNEEDEVNYSRFLLEYS